ncbi:MAG TPA: FecR family protein [Bacteroidota bacterium]|nr:FecR family protein [Bacteroidota bacterium]
MKRKSVLLGIVVLSALVISPAWRQQQDKKDIAAYVIKVVKDVKKKAGGSTTGWQQAIPLDQLKSGHLIQTETGSFALIKFSDETKLLVREKSEVEIKGQVQGKQVLDRDVHTTRGNVGFDVKKQEKESFRFSSPLSVASIRGTTGSYTRLDQINTDQLTIGNGLATFTNLLSNQSVDVGSHQTGITDDKGTLNVRTSTNQEHSQTTTSVPGHDETPATDTQNQKKQHELRFTAEDKSGNRKTVVIYWDE